jgi:hypothetical protein
MAAAWHQGQWDRPVATGSHRTLACAAALGLTLAGAGWGQDLPPDQLGTAAGGVSITSVEPGFSDGASSFVRADYCVPIDVQILNRSGRLFPGKLQVISRDRDGETVIYELSGFAVESGRVDDKQLSFFARNPGPYAAATELMVRLLDDRDRPVHSRRVQLDYLKESDHLVLDISPQSIKAVIQSALPNDDSLRFRGQVRVAYMQPERLPAFWHELEAVDVIVCDQPDGAGLRMNDIDVLAQWVRQGGSLVLGPGSLQSLADSDLGKALPAKPQGARRLPAGQVRLEGLNTSLTIRPSREMGIWTLQPRVDATVLLRLPAEAGGQPVLVRRRVGFGSVVESGISLKVLLDRTSEEGLAPGMGARIKPEIFGIRTVDVPPNVQAGGFVWGVGWPNRGQGPTDLLQGEADFRASGAVLATLLMLLIVAYGLAATVGSWAVLKRRKLVQHSWLAFAGVAIIGSVGAAMLVQSARGIRADVKQQSVIDVDGATGLASIHTFYGLKMPYDARVDVEVATVGHDDLPPDQLKQAYIRPAGDLERANADSSFAVKREYTIRYGQAQLTGVPVRATAKQFESYWYGPVRGTFRASLAAAQGGGLRAGSWIANDTDLDLRDCYLIYARTDSLSRSVRDGLIEVVRVDQLKAGQTRNDLSGLMDAGVGGGAVQARRLSDVTKDWWKDVPVEMPGWAVRPQGDQQASRTDGSRMLAAAMISVLSDVPSQDPSSYAPYGGGKIRPFMDLPREGARWLDLRNVLDGRSALLIGLVASPGPMRLKVNGVVQPSAGQCIVRVALPLAVPPGE